MALENGVSRREIESLPLSTTAYQQLRRELDENQILEFSMLVGHYVMAAMMLDVAGCKVEPTFSLDTR
jgi:hypothetical protein